MGKIISFVKKETVLCVSALLAVISAFAIPPSLSYVNYIDLRTLSLLMCLMTVMAGLRKIGVFSMLTKKLIGRVHTLRHIVTVLVMLCFVFSMVVTNDVALITFVPFAIEVLNKTGNRSKMIFVIVMQTIAANLGSMLTPVGNPQNLYLYSVSQMGTSEFISLMLPYTVVSLILIVGCMFFVKNERVSIDNTAIEPIQKKSLIFYLIMFAAALAAVAKILPYGAVLLLIIMAVLVFDRKVLLKVDYSLLFTFVFFFVFIGNMGNIPQFSEFIEGILNGNEVLSAVVSSQFISNVPAALLLSGFTTKYNLLIIGTNIGGLGTLIASMASLISYKYFANENGGQKGKYIAVFSVFNIAFLAVFVGMYFVLK